jgi:hypothetical protein
MMCFMCCCRVCSNTACISSVVTSRPNQTETDRFRVTMLLGCSPTEATRLRFDQEKITLQSPTGRTFSSFWSFSHQRDHDAMTPLHELSVVDFFLDRIAVASPWWEKTLIQVKTSVYMTAEDFKRSKHEALQKYLCINVMRARCHEICKNHLNNEDDCLLGCCAV